MAETANIAKMAEKLSDDLFAEFLWTKVGPMNMNWACEKQEEHRVKTHPTDVVFCYDEPYSGTRRYVQCDLKSYAKSSISKSSVRGAVVSLAKQLSCAESSEQWQGMYIDDYVTPEISALLFIYNHDLEYDASFGGLLSDIRPEDLNLPSRAKLFVMGPDDINWLERVASEIRQMRGRGELSAREEMSFYYPQRVRKKNVQFDHARAATLEMLSSPWIVLQCVKEENGCREIVIFHRRQTTVDGIVYLLDYLRQCQLIVPRVNIHIKVDSSDKEARLKLQKAVNKYIHGLSGQNQDSDLARRLMKIGISFVPEYTTAFSEVGIGMEYE